MGKGLIPSALIHLLVFSLLCLQVRARPQPSYPTVYRVNLVGSLRVPEPEPPEPEPTPAPPPTPTPAPLPKPKEAPKEREEVVKGPLGLGASVVGGEGFEYSYYLSIILSKIGENWRNPYRGARLSLTAVVSFKIARDGRIYEVELGKGSGDGVYDQAALRAVYATRALPPLPPEFGGEFLKVHLEFEYTL